MEQCAPAQSPFAKALIINADDFGLSAGVNEGVVQAHQHGILTSATLLGNAPGFNHAVQLAKENPRLGVGVHLNIVRGRPLSPAATVPDLLNSHGEFRRFRFRFFNQAILAQAEREYRRQIETILAAGIVPDHVDFEKHHAWQKPLYTLVARLAEDYGIPAIRWLREPVAWAIRRIGWPGLRRAGMASVLRSGVQLFGGTTNLIHPEHFLGQTHIGCMDAAAWLRLLDNVPDGVSEVMTHPGLSSEEDTGMGHSWLGQSRQRELQALTSDAVVAKVQQCGLACITFADLAQKQPFQLR